MKGIYPWSHHKRVKIRATGSLLLDILDALQNAIKDDLITHQKIPDFILKIKMQTNLKEKFSNSVHDAYDYVEKRKKYSYSLE